MGASRYKLVKQGQRFLESGEVIESAAKCVPAGRASAELTHSVPLAQVVEFRSEMGKSVGMKAVFM